MKNYTELFTGRTALVTGGSKRLGRAIALELAAYGVRVIIHYHKGERLARELVDAIKRRGGTACALQADLSYSEEVEGLLYRATECYGPVDYLINNASIYTEANIEDMQFADLCDNMLINTYAPLLLCRSFCAQKNRGVIINMLDTRIHSYDRDHLGYHMSKQALFSLTKMMAWEYSPHIRVNGVAPGIVLPPEGEGEEWLERMRHTNPLDSYGTVEDVSDAVCFLLASDFITGELIHIDGGRHLKNNFYG